MSYKKNVGKIDKWSRIALGVIAVGVGCYLQSWIWIVVGIIIFGTGLASWCGLYRMLGISTCEIKAVEKNNKESSDSEKIN